MQPLLIFKFPDVTVLIRTVPKRKRGSRVSSAYPSSDFDILKGYPAMAVSVASRFYPSPFLHISRTAAWMTLGCNSMPKPPGRGITGIIRWHSYHPIPFYPVSSFLGPWAFLF
jgi:hypothetical protein